MNLVKQKIVSGNFVIDIYKQKPSINIEDIDVDELEGNEYGTHGYEVTLQDTEEVIYHDFKTQWGVDTCLDNAMHDIDVYDEGAE
tara:strand:- start:299 stop:553 length:255 start_codon:yes stop_codon:yes gene_type:complete